MSSDEKSDEKSTSAMKRDLSVYLGEDVLVTPPVKHTKNAVPDGDFDDSSFVTGDNENDPVVICHFRRGVAKKLEFLQPCHLEAQTTSGGFWKELKVELQTWA